MPHDVDVRILGDDPRIVQLTMNRPHRKNAYTQRLCDELCAALVAADRDPVVRVVVLTGARDAFSSGGDVQSEDEVERGDGHPFGHGDVMRDTGHAVVRTLTALGTPVIAAINGAAVAGGLTFALACDLRIAGSSARLGDTSMRFGLLPDEGGAWLFPRTMGLEAALRMSLLGEVYDADRALALGLVGEVVSDEDLPAATLALAGRLADAPPLAVRTVRQLMRRSQEATQEQTLESLAAAVNVVNVSADVQEGVAAFLGRRPATFRGR
jgi:enoyl-CoA hydratase/carnithine racemase